MMTCHSKVLLRMGFTLMELLVVITIIAVLASMLMVAVKLVRRGANGAVCLHNLGQMHLGIAGYVENWGAFPPTQGPYGSAGWPQAKAATLLQSGHGNSDGNGARDVLKCPADRRIVNDGTNGGFFDRRTYMQTTWINNEGITGGEWTRIWSSYCSNQRVFNGTVDDPNDPPTTVQASGRVGLFWDAYEMTTSYPWSNVVLESIPGVNRHGGGVNMLYGDGHAARLDCKPIGADRFWEIVPWASDWWDGMTHHVNAGIGEGPFDQAKAPWIDL